MSGSALIELQRLIHRIVGRDQPSLPLWRRYLVCLFGFTIGSIPILNNMVTDIDSFVEFFLPIIQTTPNIIYVSSIFLLLQLTIMPFIIATSFERGTDFRHFLNGIIFAVFLPLIIRSLLNFGA